MTDALRREVDDRGHEAEYFAVRGAARPRRNLPAPRGQVLGLLRGKDDAVVVLSDQAHVQSTLEGQDDAGWKRRLERRDGGSVGAVDRVNGVDDLECR